MLKLPSNHYPCKAILLDQQTISAICCRGLGSMQAKRLCSEVEDQHHSWLYPLWSWRFGHITLSAGDSNWWYVPCLVLMHYLFYGRVKHPAGYSGDLCIGYIAFALNSCLFGHRSHLICLPLIIYTFVSNVLWNVVDMYMAICRQYIQGQVGCGKGVHGWMDVPYGFITKLSDTCGAVRLYRFHHPITCITLHVYKP